MRVATVEEPSGNLEVTLRCDDRGGLRLMAERQGTGEKLVVDVNPRGSRVLPEPSALLPRSALDAMHSYPGPASLAPTNAVHVLLKVRSEAWALYVDDRLKAVVPSPFPPPLSIACDPVHVLEDGCPPSVAFQKTEDFEFTEHFLIPEGETNAASEQAVLSGWEILSGQWRLHTAADATAEEGPARKPERKGATPDRSPNFYSVQGSGTQACMLAGYEFYDRYRMEAAVRTGEGEGGILLLVTEKGDALGFTAAMPDDEATEVTFRLWEVSGGDWDRRRPLAAVRAAMTAGQWIKLAARVWDDRVECSVDRTPVIEQSLPLPPGGRFGLFADTRGGASIRFDDVKARSERSLDLRRRSEAAFHARVEDGAFFPRPESASRGGVEGPETVLAPPRRSAEQQLLFGPLDQGPHVLTAAFEPGDAESVFGLVAGYAGPDQPYYRWVRQADRRSELFRLERVKPNLVTVLEDVRVPLHRSSAPAGRAVRLMSDSTEGLLRLYRDGELVLLHQPSAPLKGASGVYLGPQAAVRIRNLRHQIQRDDLYRNQFEKNRIFVEDPFMRHWSSPEGQWYEDPARGGTWYKGDCYGRVAVYMPYLPSSEIHLGVEEGQTNGTVVLNASDENLTLLYGEPGGGRLRTLECIPVGDLAALSTNHPESAASTRWYTLNAEGYWIWLTSGERLLLKSPLSAPLRGRRMRIAGFNTEQLKFSRVDLYHVKDYLFTESLHEWVINGGRWEVVSRFQCQPQWSHMNGESADSLAALWTKYEFRGDFCVEMYAGMRHGWYQRCGDLNLTVMNRDTTPSQGYTVTCAGWDPDHSQLYTTLYREGSVAARSDRYLVPRFREGNRRLTGDPLIRQGRDVHGAWYYIRFRRAGRRLEYYFDNELVFAAEDDSPLPQGGFGIWTFLNSMVIARVRIAAEDIRPRPLPFTRLEDASAPYRAESWEPPPPVVLINDVPGPILTPRYWTSDDAVGHMQLSWCPDPEGGGYLVTSNRLGSGNMAARCNGPPVPWPDIAGWSFEVQRTPRALLNFYYSIGRLDGNGVYVPHQRFFHRISGPDFAKGKFRMSGSSSVPPTAADSAAWHARGAWTPVTVWIPGDGGGLPPMDSNVLVRVEGFGLLQTCAELQGVTGNGPGEGYAVRNLREIRYAPPRLSPATNLPAALFVARDPATGRELGRAPSPAELSARLAALEGEGFHACDVTASLSPHPVRLPLAWIRLPPRPAIRASWGQRIPDTIELTCEAPYPDPRLTRSSVRLGDLSLQSLPDSGPSAFRVRRFPLPRAEEFTRHRLQERTVELQIADQTFHVPLDKPVDPDCRPPVLVAVEGPFPVAESFERRALLPPLAVDAARMELGFDDADQGTYLVVRNRGTAERLRTPFMVRFNLARHPVFRMRYRASGLVQVSLGFDQPWRVLLNEPVEMGRAVRAASPLHVDSSWHTWQGILSDAVTAQRLEASPLSVGQLVLGSFHPTDQTGLFSEWHLDDVVLGPAVSRPDQAAFTPRYHDDDGVAEVRFAVLAGERSDRDSPPSERQSLRWSRARPGEVCVPSLEGLPDGFAQILVQAVDLHGNVSAITELPFLKDTKPPRLTARFEKTTDPLGNESKLIVAAETDGGAPLDLDALVLKWNETVVSPVSLGSGFHHAPTQDVVALNWPLIFRRELDATSDGATNHIVVTSLSDGAGNAAQDLDIIRVTDYASDRTPPTIANVAFPSNILLAIAAERGGNPTLGFQPQRETRFQVLHDEDQAPYLRAESPAGEGAFLRRFEGRPWSVAAYPYVAFRMRRPTYHPEEKTRLCLVLEMAGGGESAIFLGPGSARGKELSLPKPPAWASNEWRAIVLDLRVVLQGAMRPDAFNAARVIGIGFRLADAPRNVVVDLQQLCVMAPWGRDDAVRVNAFDASGIAGLVCGDQILEGRSVTPALLPTGLADESGWVAIRVRDRAGNFSSPLRLPLLTK